jgi:hypothetical protein
MTAAECAPTLRGHQEAYQQGTSPAHTLKHANGVQHQKMLKYLTWVNDRTHSHWQSGSYDAHWHKSAIVQYTHVQEIIPDNSSPVYECRQMSGATIEFASRFLILENDVLLFSAANLQELALHDKYSFALYNKYRAANFKLVDRRPFYAILGSYVAGILRRLSCTQQPSVNTIAGVGGSAGASVAAYNPLAALELVRCDPGAWEGGAVVWNTPPKIDTLKRFEGEFAADDYVLILPENFKELIDELVAASLDFELTVRKITFSASGGEYGAKLVTITPRGVHRRVVIAPPIRRGRSRSLPLQRLPVQRSNGEGPGTGEVHMPFLSG